MNKIFFCNTRRAALIAALAALMALAAGCSGGPPVFSRQAEGPSIYEDPGTPGAVQSLGFGSQDVISLTDRMMRDIMAQGFWQGKKRAPRIMLDRNCFTNQGPGDLNLRLITDRLRVTLNRAARGKMVFMAPYLYQYDIHADDPYGKHLDARKIYPHEADFRLCGNITALDLQSPNGMLVSRYTQVSMELVHRKTASLVWGGIYSFRKAASRWDVDPRSARNLTRRPQPRAWRGSANAGPFDALLNW